VKIGGQILQVYEFVADKDFPPLTIVQLHGLFYTVGVLPQETLIQSQAAQLLELEVKLQNRHSEVYSLVDELWEASNKLGTSESRVAELEEELCLLQRQKREELESKDSELQSALAALSMAEAHAQRLEGRHKELLIREKDQETHEKVTIDEVKSEAESELLAQLAQQRISHETQTKKLWSKHRSVIDKASEIIWQLQSLKEGLEDEEYELMAVANTKSPAHSEHSSSPVRSMSSSPSYPTSVASKPSFLASTLLKTPRSSRGCSQVAEAPSTDSNFLSPQGSKTANDDYSREALKLRRLAKHRS
jgi:hypothetical protein